MSIMHALSNHVPLLVISGCLIVLFRRAGYRQPLLLISGLPFLLVMTSFIATLIGERGMTDPVLGAWTTTALTVVLAFRPWPGGGKELG